MRSKVKGFMTDRVEILCEISHVFEVDISTESGVWEFLQLHQTIKNKKPAPPLEKVATCTTNKEPFEAQEMKLFSNLVFVVIHCRTASICGHYSQSERPLPCSTTGNSDIVRQMKLDMPKQKGVECTKAVKHAGNVIEAFDTLYELDKERLADSWLLLYGGLMALVLYQINGLREKGNDWEGMVNKFRDRFSELKVISPELPLFDKAIGILAEHGVGDFQTSITPRSRPKLRMTRRVSSPTSGEGDPRSKEPKQSNSATRPKPQPRRKRSLDEVAGSSLHTKVRPRKSVKTEVCGLDSATSSFNGHDVVLQDRSMFELGNVLSAGPSHYDERFGGTEFYGQPSFDPSATTSSASGQPPQIACSTTASPPDWAGPIDNTGYQWFPEVDTHPFGHPPMAITQIAHAHAPFAHGYNGYDELDHRFPNRRNAFEHIQNEAPIIPAPTLSSCVPTAVRMLPLLAIEQAPAPDPSEASLFLNTTPKHFEQKRTENAISGLASPRNSQVHRRPSEPTVPMRESIVASRAWRDDQEQGGAPMLGTEQLSGMLPPRPETVWFQPDHCNTTHQGAYYSGNDLQYQHYHATQYAMYNAAVTDHNHMQRLSQYQIHH